MVETARDLQKAEGQGVHVVFPLDCAAFYQVRQRGLLLGEFMVFIFRNKQLQFLDARFVLTLALCLGPPSLVVIRNLKIHPNTFPFLVLLSNLGPNIKH